MVRSDLWCWLPLLGLVTGCVLTDNPTTPMVSDNPFAAPATAPPISRTHYAPAATDTAARVETLGRSILAANPQVGVRPLFRTIGAPQAEIFHQGTAEITLTE